MKLNILFSNERDHTKGLLDDAVKSMMQGGKSPHSSGFDSRSRQKTFGAMKSHGATS